MMTQNIKKRNGLLLIFFIPYILSNVFLFFESININPYLNDLLKESQSLLNVDTIKFYSFVVILVVFMNVIILFITFLLIKLATQLILKKEFNNEQNLLLSLLLSSSISVVIFLLLSEFFYIEYSILSLLISMVEYLTFVLLYKTHTDNSKEIVAVSGVKFILLLINTVFIFQL